MSHTRATVQANPQERHTAAAPPPVALDIRQLAALLGAADEAGEAPVVLGLVRPWKSGRRLFRRLRQLAERLGWVGGWVYPARLFACVDALIETQTVWAQPAEVLAAPVPPLEHLLWAARERGLGQGSGKRGALARLVLRLSELQRASDAGVAEHGELAALALRVRRLEEKVAELSSRRPEEGALGLCTSTGARIDPPGLRAGALARLLAAAQRRALEAPCLALMHQSPGGARLCGLLMELREAVGERFTWAYLAQLLRRVEAWEEALLAGRRQVLRSSAGEPLEDLEAATRLRSAEAGRDRRAELERLAQRLAQRREPSRQQPAKPAVSPKAPKGQRGRKR